MRIVPRKTRLHGPAAQPGQNPIDEVAAVSAGGQAQPREQAAKVLAFLEADAAAVDFGDIADDGETEARSGLAGRIEPGAAAEQFAAPFLGYAGAVILDQHIDGLALV